MVFQISEDELIIYIYIYTFIPEVKLIFLIDFKNKFM